MDSMTGVVSLKCGGYRERIDVSAIDLVEFGSGRIMFSAESLKQMGLCADGMYAMFRMADGEIKVLEVPEYMNMVFMPV